MDLADYTVWRNNLGSSDEAVINSAGDYEIWKSYFGESLNGEDGIARNAVPEPSSVALTVLAIAAMAGRFDLRRRLPC